MSKVITREREKLYVQMEENFEKQSELNPEKLFLHLRTEEKSGKISFVNYSEFLNIINTIFLFYSCASNLKKFSYDILIILLMDSSFLVFALLYHFITRIKKIKKETTRISFTFAILGIIISKIIFKENIAIKYLNWVFLGNF